MLISESEVGVSVAAIRQNPGTSVNICPLGAVYVPAGIDWAAVIVVSGSAKLAKCAHVAAAPGVAPMPERAVASVRLAVRSRLVADAESPRFELLRLGLQPL